MGMSSVLGMGLAIQPDYENGHSKTLVLNK